MRQQTIKQMIEMTKERFPDWQSFTEESFFNNEIEYKRHTVELAQELLGAKVFRKMIAKAQYDEIISRLGKIGRDNNLLWLSMPLKGDLAIMHQPKLDKVAFCNNMCELLHGRKPDQKRIAAFIQYTQDNNLPNKWTFFSYFLFIFHPEKHYFVKPKVMKWFLNFIDKGELYKRTPSPSIYEEFLTIVNELKDTLAPFQPQDMVDIQSFIWVAWDVAQGNWVNEDLVEEDSWEFENQVRIWKIAPGRKAENWEACRDGGYISIGWSKLGDISEMDRGEFIKRRDQLVAENDNWTASGADQVWRFANKIFTDNIIVANNGTKQIVGIGKVTGDYYFVPGERYPHRLPVKWFDTTPRQINEMSWKRTLIPIDHEKYKEILAMSTGATNGPSAFSQEAFSLLAQLHANPTKAFYLKHKQEFLDHLETPFKKFFREIAANLPASMTDLLETEKYLFGVITKNDWGRGGAWDFYWGAFYPHGSKRIKDAQLFLSINKDILEFGFYIGEYGKESHDRFYKNYQENNAVLKEKFMELFANNDFIFGPREEHLSADNVCISMEDWLTDPAQYSAQVAVRLDRETVLQTAKQDLSDQILTAFKQLFPLVILSALDKPMTTLIDYLDSMEPIEPDLNPEYSLEQCARETFYPQAMLEQWVQAIERKGQAIIYGPPGTGKTFIAEHLAEHLIGGGDGFNDLVQFHPAYAYEDFIQGLRPEADGDHRLTYNMIPGRFLEFCQEARKRNDVCVLIIDEINRANLARVFGELMYLLEYRDKNIPLAGGKKFQIPANVRLIGTMNTADRSIALVDHALRRRFAFLHLAPDYDVLEKYHQHNGFDARNLRETLQMLNQEIGDPHYEVGISFFLRKDLSEQIADIWQMEIEPYLQEFFFDKPEKADQFRWDNILNKVLP